MSTNCLPRPNRPTRISHEMMFSTHFGDSITIFMVLTVSLTSAHGDSISAAPLSTRKAWGAIQLNFDRVFNMIFNRAFSLTECPVLCWKFCWTSCWNSIELSPRLSGWSKPRGIPIMGTRWKTGGRQSNWTKKFIMQVQFENYFLPAELTTQV